MTTHETPAIRLPNGRIVAMPLTPRWEEFALVGRAREYAAAGMWAFYDPETRTGAIYYLRHDAWQLQQPVQEENFWLHAEILSRAELGQGIADALLSEIVRIIGPEPAGHA